MEKTYLVGDVLSGRQAESLLSKLIYSIEGITACALSEDKQSIHITLTPDCDLSAIGRTIGIMIENEKKQRIVGHRIYRENTTTSSLQAFLHDVKTIFADNGQVRRELSVKLLEKLDGIFEQIACRYQANLRCYTSIISLRTLEKCRYIQSFPQNIHLVSEIPHQLEQLERVKHEGNITGIARLSPYALSPAVCFHCYEELSESRIDAPLVLTARGTCFRHEAPWRVGKHRLNEFSMREIVLIGDSNTVETLRKKIMEDVWGLFESLGLHGRIETASDLFYFSEDSVKSQHQLMGNMKYELIAALAGGQESFSIASFNHIGESLCNPFDVRDTNENIMNSGCIAFGLDRWLYALLATYGTDYSSWPAAVKEIMNSSWSVQKEEEQV